MIIKSDLEACRRDIEACVGRKVRLTTNGGRRRTVIREGILEHCYPNVFMVRCIQRKTHGDLSLPRKTEMVSYSYIDVLTRVVEIEVGPPMSPRSEATDTGAAEDAAVSTDGILCSSPDATEDAESSGIVPEESDGELETELSGAAESSEPHEAYKKE